MTADFSRLPQDNDLHNMIHECFLKFIKFCIVMWKNVVQKVICYCSDTLTNLKHITHNVRQQTAKVSFLGDFQVSLLV